MPFPMPGHGVVPGPNAFAQRLTPPPAPNVQASEDARAPYESATRVNSVLYSPSVYSEAGVEGQYEMLRETQTTPTLGPSSSEHFFRALDGPKKQLSSQRSSSSTSRLIGGMKLMPSPNPNSQPTPRWLIENKGRKEGQPKARSLSPIDETDTMSSLNATQRRANSPAPLNLTRARAYGASKNAKLKIIGNEASTTSSSSTTNTSNAESTTPMRRFIERIRGPPVYASPSESKVTRKPSKELLPKKAAQVLGTNLGEIKKQEAASKSFPRTRFPSFGQMGLPEPNPPFASDDLGIKRRRGSPVGATTPRNFSPRMMRETSDPRLLVLNDRIASNADNTTPPSHENEKRVGFQSEDDEPPTPPEKSPNQLRRIYKRLSIGSSSTPKVTNSTDAVQQSARDEARFPAQLYSGATQKQPEMVEKRDQIVSSIYGSLHDSVSQEELSYQTENPDLTYEKAGYNWPLQFGDSPSFVSERSLYPNLHPTLYPSPLHIQPKRFDTLESKQSRDTVQTEGSLVPVVLDDRADPPHLDSFRNPPMTQKAEPHGYHKTRADNGKLSSKVTDDAHMEKEVLPAKTYTTPRQMTSKASNQREHTAGSPNGLVFSNQPWCPTGSPHTNIVDPSMLREITARLDVQRDNIFELKGLFSETAKSNDSVLAKLSASINSMDTDIRQLAADVHQIRDLVIKAMGQNHTPALTRSSTSSHNGEPKESPRRSKRSYPPVSFPNTLGTVADASSGRCTPLYSPDAASAHRVFEEIPRRDSLERTQTKSGGSSNKHSPRKASRSGSEHSTSSRYRQGKKQASSPTRQDTKTSHIAAISPVRAGVQAYFPIESTTPSHRRANNQRIQAREDNHGLGIDDLADFGVNLGRSPTGRSDPRSESKTSQGYWECLAKRDRNWRSLG